MITRRNSNTNSSQESTELEKVKTTSNIFNKTRMSRDASNLNETKVKLKQKSSIFITRTSKENLSTRSKELMKSMKPLKITLFKINLDEIYNFYVRIGFLFYIKKIFIYRSKKKNTKIYLKIV